MASVYAECYVSVFVLAAPRTDGGTTTKCTKAAATENMTLLLRVERERSLAAAAQCGREGSRNWWYGRRRGGEREREFGRKTEEEKTEKREVG